MSKTIDSQSPEEIQAVVRKRYGQAATNVMEKKDRSCCGSSCCASEDDAISSNLYDENQAELIPRDALAASLGCGNPTALAQLNEGETVLDLGSGGGIDVLLSARRVGPSGFAFGLDMTDEMLSLAEKNKAESGLTNVTFLKGHIESIPLPSNSVDVIISNCVINLSVDKDQVLREAFRVLKPGGRFAVSDVVVEGELPDAVRQEMEAYVGCVAGALEKEDYIARLKAVGFGEVDIEATRRYTFGDLEGGCCSAKAVTDLPTNEKLALDGKIMGAFIRASKPGASE